MNLRQQYMHERDLVDACDVSDASASQKLFAELTFCATQRRLVERYVERHRAKPRHEGRKPLADVMPHLDDYEARTGELK